MSSKKCEVRKYMSAFANFEGNAPERIWSEAIDFLCVGKDEDGKPYTFFHGEFDTRELDLLDPSLEPYHLVPLEEIRKSAINNLAGYLEDRKRYVDGASSLQLGDAYLTPYRYGDAGSNYLVFNYVVEQHVGGSWVQWRKAWKGGNGNSYSLNLVLSVRVKWDK